MSDVPPGGEPPASEPPPYRGDTSDPLDWGPVSATADDHEDAATAAAVGGSATASRRKSSTRSTKTKRRRWPRRLLITGGVVVLLAVALALAGYFYVDYEFHQITVVKVHHLQKLSKPGGPFTVLLVGSDSRAFVDNSGQCKAFGCGASQGGQRSDVIILVRVVPAKRRIEMLSIPRDTWVAIPGHVQYVSGQNRINAAFNDGPSLLVQTIEQDFHVPGQLLRRGQLRRAAEHGRRDRWYPPLLS